MTFHVVAVGRVRNRDLATLCDDYAARTRHYAKLEIHEIPDKSRQAKDPARALREEGRALLRAIPDARLVALCRDGRRVDSRAFAGRLERWQQDGRDLAFVIGGAFGLDTAVRQACEEAISLSDMTYPHEVARLMLLEQIYRGHTILRGEPYHKGD
ncbi:MAG: 23S rRNA (pseudouridine(1915)-N(3))-methyltransferase RlmH [Gemmatimonadetes bacterium]|nr:23S rRNA (pseudouridine(1915)-N(3))-methyltransferase RlmH [Gemmatimonadota bacterium]